jgi:hypothetical protein
LYILKYYTKFAAIFIQQLYVHTMKKIVLLTFFTLLSLFAIAQDFMLQGWYWDYPKTANGANWVNTINTQVPGLAGKFTYLWLPPLAKPSSGNFSNGYDPRDLFDYGQYNNGCPWGNRAGLNALTAACNIGGIKTVADLVYNHRDGGRLEINPALKTYMDNLNGTVADPYPCDRMMLAIPLGALNPGANGAGDYYFKFSSKTGSYGSNHRYSLQFRTGKTTGYLGTVDEVEPNGGGDCAQAFNTVQIGQEMRAYLGTSFNCDTDEFKVTLAANDMLANGTTRDTLWITMKQLEGGYSDHRPYGVWSTSRNANIVNEVLYMTHTNYAAMPSGRGYMNYQSFKPNGTIWTGLRGEQDAMLFYYDYEQNNAACRDTLNAWTKWNWHNVGIRGFRIDAVKHFSTGFFSQLLNYMNANNMNPGLVVGESYDGNPNVLKGWVDAVKGGMTASAQANINPRVFDFALRGALRDACDTYGYDVRSLYYSGVVEAAGGSGSNVVAFVNNHDFRDANGWASPIHNDPILAYAYILTNNRVGMPCVFYPDYFGVSYPHAPTEVLKPKIDALIKVHKDHIFGATQVEYLNKEGSFYQSTTGAYNSGSKANSLIYQVKGGASGKDVIVAINFSGARLQVNHVINGSGNPLGTKFYDQFGNSAFAYAQVDGAGKIYIDLPPRSYTVFVKDVNPFYPKLEARTFLHHVSKTTILMNDAIRTQADFPLSDPYAVAPLNTKFVHVNSGPVATTTASVLGTTGDNAIVDWVFLELRNGTSPSSTVAYTRSALLQADGDIVDTDGESPVGFPNAVAGDYYVTVRHRNHLGFRTLNKSTFSASAKTVLDFTNASVALYGITPLVNIYPTLLAMNAGDSDSDGSIDSIDSAIWEIQNGSFNIYSLRGDYNLDGSVDSIDSALWELNNGKYEELN